MMLQSSEHKKSHKPSPTPLCLGIDADACSIPRKKGLSAEFFYVREPVSVFNPSDTSRSLIGVVLSLTGNIASNQGVMSVGIGNGHRDPINIPFEHVSYRVGKLIGNCFILDDIQISTPIPIRTGDDACCIPRKKGLSAEYFYQGEPVSVVNQSDAGERILVGMVLSLKREIASNEGVMSVGVLKEVINISFANVSTHVRKLIGYYQIVDDDIEAAEPDPTRRYPPAEAGPSGEAGNEPAPSMALNKARPTGASIVNENMISDVHRFLDRQEDKFLKHVFDQHSENRDSGGFIGEGMLKKALSKLLEADVTSEKVAELLAILDQDSRGGLDFEEFKRAVEQSKRLSEVELWASRLSLAGMLAASLPVKSDLSLRHLSTLGDDDISAAVDAFSVGLRRLLTNEIAALKQVFESVDIKASEAAKDSSAGVSAGSKLKTYNMSTGSIADYHEGLSKRIGAPNPNLSKGIHDEHKEMWGFNVHFKTRNYGVKTTPEKEYDISTGSRPCAEEDMVDRNGKTVRVYKSIKELKDLKLCLDASLIEEEILSVVLYSGPMFELYNMILRESHPVIKFQEYKQGGNQFSTTIFVLQSAIVKISREVLLPSGLELYRGLGGQTELPNSFDKMDKRGCRGYTEWAFFSTTSLWETAVDYSGVNESKPLPMVIQLRAASIDRGACIKCLSQYPGEVTALLEMFLLLMTDSKDVQVEYVFPAGSYIEPSGQSYMIGVCGGESLLRVVPVRINANVKAQTVEQLVTMKKEMHVNSFKCLLAETERVLIAESKGAECRLKDDSSRVKSQERWFKAGGKQEWLLQDMLNGADVTFTVPGLIARIMQQCKAVLKRHDEASPDQYNDEKTFRCFVTEMLESMAAALSTLRGYIDDSSAMIELVMRDTIMTRHRAYLSYLLNQMRTLPAKSEGRASKALQLCKIIGAVQSLVDTLDAEGFTPLMRAAADGAGGWVMRCLVDAGAEVDCRDAEGRTALRLAAEFGHAEAVESLASLRGDVNATAYQTTTNTPPIWIAAQEGHVEVIKSLGRFKADVNHADKHGRTPVYIAAFMGHAAATEALIHLGADINQASHRKKTPFDVATEKKFDEVVDVLRKCVELHAAQQV